MACCRINQEAGGPTQPLKGIAILPAPAPLLGLQHVATMPCLFFKIFIKIRGISAKCGKTFIKCIFHNKLSKHERCNRDFTKKLFLHVWHRDLNPQPSDLCRLISALLFHRDSYLSDRSLSNYWDPVLKGTWRTSQNTPYKSHQHHFQEPVHS